MKKKIILINEIGLNEIFTKAFEEEGFEVISILRTPFVYKRNISNKLWNIYYRLFRNDNDFHGRNFYKQLNKEVYKKLVQINGPIDYCLIFRADYYNEKNIKLLRSKSAQMISYQYDGWELGKGITRYKNYLDRVFFFDKQDIARYGSNAYPITNCYFPTKNLKTSVEYDVFYLGTSTKTRLEQIKNLHQTLENKFTLKTILKIPKYQTERDENGLVLSHHSLSYSENLELLQKSKCLVDIKFDYHDGLSFRFFEALFYKKKLITNNASVKHYDFYHPNNIFITDFIDFNGLENFLTTPYQEIDQCIVDKYGFTNWSRYILSIAPHTKIELP